MRPSEAVARLRQHETELKELGVRRLYLFGSTARDEARPDSDVDLFFDYDRGHFGAFGLMEVMERASVILECKTDITTRDGLHKLLRQQIEAMAVRVF